MRVKAKRIGLILVLFIILAGLVSIAWSQDTYTVTFNPAEDAYVDIDSPDANYGSSSELVLYYNGKYAYLKFNLSDFTLPVERISSAKLRIYVTYYSSSTTLYAYPAADSWTESNITYDSKPSFDTSIKSSVSVTSTGFYEVDVTNILLSCIDVNDKICSIVLKLNSGQTVKIASKEYAEADKWPQLIIEYEPYTETTSQTITETVTTTMTDYITETQTITTTQTDTIYTTETAYTTETSTVTQTITDVITETATTTITQIETAWANQTVTITTTMTPTTTVTVYGNETVTMTEYGNSTAPEINYQALADALMPIVLIVGVISTLLGLLLQSTNFRRGD